MHVFIQVHANPGFVEDSVTYRVDYLNQLHDFQSFQKLQVQNPLPLILLEIHILTSSTLCMQSAHIFNNTSTAKQWCLNPYALCQSQWRGCANMCTWLNTYQKVRKFWKWRAEILTTTSHTATFRCPPDLRIRWARKSLASEQLEGSSSVGRPSESQCCRIPYNSYLCCQIYTQYNPCPYCFETILRFYVPKIDHVTSFTI